MQEKSKNIFEDSKQGTIGARIKVLLVETNKSVTELESFAKVGNGTLKTWKDKSLEFSTNVVDTFKRNMKIREDWWKSGNGEIFLTHEEKPDDNKKTPEFRENVYRTIVEGNTEYLLIPRAVMNEVQLISTKQLENDRKVMDKLLDQNEKLIARVIALDPQLPTIQEGKNNP